MPEGNNQALPPTRPHTSTSREPSPGHVEALRQTEYLRRPGVRAIWKRLTPEQQQRVLDPSSHPAVGHRYPLSTREVATLAGLSESRVRWWADHNQIPHERTAGGHRVFGIAGLLSALALADSRQFELRFYRELAEAPGEIVSAKVETLLFILESRRDGVRSAEGGEQLDRTVLSLQGILVAGAGSAAERGAS